MSIRVGLRHIIRIAKILAVLVTVDSYSEANYDNWYSMYTLHPSATWGASLCWQSFTCGTAAKLTSCKFYLKKLGSPTGTVTARLYSHSGTYGTSSVPGTLLATSDAFNVSTLTTNFTLATFIFSGSQQYTMSANTKYVIVLINDNDVVNIDNYIIFGLDATSPTHGGNSGYYRNSAWTPESGHDAIFYVYGMVGG